MLPCLLLIFSMGSQGQDVIDIRIVGLQRTSRELVLEQMASRIGETDSEARRRVDFLFLDRLGIFSSIRVEPEIGPEGVILYVFLVETFPMAPYVSITGTLLGGYADELFNILYRLDPRAMREDGFDHGEGGLRQFAEAYGVLEKVTTIEASENSCSKARVSTRRSPDRRHPARTARSLVRTPLAKRDAGLHLSSEAGADRPQLCGIWRWRRHGLLETSSQVDGPARSWSLFQC
jgi:outer membrane protein assembly factor BamA